MTEVNWRQIFAVSSLLMALLLIGGSIYLHVQQKHHLGRLHLQPHNVIPAPGVDAASINDISTEHNTEKLPADYFYTDDNDSESNEYTYSDEEHGALQYLIDTTNKLSQLRAKAKAQANSNSNLNSSAETSASATAIDDGNELNASISKEAMISAEANKMSCTECAVPSASVWQPINDACLQCICETATKCSPATCGSGRACGIFRISRLYWLDADKPRLTDVDDLNRKIDDNIDMGYSRCVNNESCARQTVTAYVKKYARDCNQDGVIDCRDHIALHMLGPTGCMQNELLPVLEYRMENCLEQFEYANERTNDWLIGWLAEHAV